MPTACAPGSLPQFPLWPPGFWSLPAPLPNPLQGIFLKYMSIPVILLLKSFLWLPSTLGRKAIFFREAAGSCSPSPPQPHPFSSALAQGLVP